LGLRLKNTTGVLLEIGELAVSALVNDDYGALRHPGQRRTADTAARQRNIHEQKVLAHHYIGGIAPIAFLTEAMARAVPPDPAPEDTAFECMYKAIGAAGRRNPRRPGSAGDPLLCGARPEPLAGALGERPHFAGAEPGEERRYPPRIQINPGLSADR